MTTTTRSRSKTPQKSNTSSSTDVVGSKDAADMTTWGDGGLFANRVYGSLVLIFGPPLIIILFIGSCKYYDGSIVKLVTSVYKEGLIQSLIDKFPSASNPYAWKMILTFSAFQLFCIKAMPGKMFHGNATASGHIPIYKANGVQSYLFTLWTLFVLKYCNLWNPADVYDHFGELLVCSNILALVLCFFLVYKGLNFPSTKDNGTNGNFIVDFFWGTELYPDIFGFSIKQFTNCRFGMMLWPMLLLCYAFKQYDMYGFISSSMIVSIVIQMVYVFKFFLWETGYFNSMDIQHDRAGYYLCWGCMMYVPSVYTMHTFYLTTHPVLLSLPAAVGLAAIGIAFVWINYDCDRQRQEFRKTNGKGKIWGKEPDYIVAEYTTGDGQLRSSYLLCSGWWGLARHFHYIPEILASVCWCLPAQTEGILPYFYPLYLTILLVDRAWRDDLRCAEKYGVYWKRYCEKVPYKIIPGAV